MSGASQAGLPSTPVDIFFSDRLPAPRWEQYRLVKGGGVCIMCNTGENIGIPATQKIQPIIDMYLCEGTLHCGLSRQGYLTPVLFFKCKAFVWAPNVF